jgi:nucleotide-binding universal stress UspA family protein
MKKILVPTDFSQVADNALKYAMEIAAKMKGELLLYHVYSFHRRLHYDPDYPENEQPYVKDIERKMEETLSKFREKTERLNIPVQTRVEENSVFFLFKNKVVQYDIDLIVMGSKGATGLERVVYGSVAATALETAKVPVLVIPPEHSLRGMDRIVLATDLNRVSADDLLPLRELAEAFSSKVTILRVNTHPGEEMPSTDNLPLQDVDAKYHEIPLTQTINDSVNAFVAQDQSDLVCMIRREKDFFDSIFKKSVTKDRVYNSAIPFLVLPESSRERGAS